MRQSGREGAQRNSYCSLKAPSAFSYLRLPQSVSLPTAQATHVGSGAKFAVRMASRRSPQMHLGSVSFLALLLRLGQIAPGGVSLSLAAIEISCSFSHKFSQSVFRRLVA